MATTNYAGVDQRTNVYAAREMLRHARPTTVFEKLAKTKNLPKNKSKTVEFRRPVVFTASTTPLSEGVTPTARAFSYEDVSATIAQYGDLVEVTDMVADTVEDPVMNDASVQVGENVGRTTEQLCWATFRAGTNVFYANGVARNAVNTVITKAKQQGVVRFLKAQKAMKITKVLMGSVNIGTKPVEASFVAVAHTDCESDIRALAGFIPTSEYGTRDTICEEEIGRVDDVRYILSPDLEPFADAGGAKGSTVSTTGTSSDVYPILYMGRDAIGVVNLGGKGAQNIEPTIIPSGTKDKSDPLGQRGYVGAKYYHASIILNDAWLVRLEVAVTDL